MVRLPYQLPSLQKSENDSGGIERSVYAEAEPRHASAGRCLATRPRRHALPRRQADRAGAVFDL
jgi:hypothetical protein